MGIIISVGIASGILYISCWGLLALKGGWLPLVPPALALMATGSSLIIYRSFSYKKIEE